MTNSVRSSFVALFAIALMLFFTANLSLAQGLQTELFPGTGVYEGEVLLIKGLDYTAISNRTFFSNAGITVIPAFFGRRKDFMGEKVGVFLDGTEDQAPLDNPSVRPYLYLANDTEIPDTSKGFFSNNGIFDRYFYGGIFAYVVLKNQTDVNLVSEKCHPGGYSIRQCDLFVAGTIREGLINSAACKMFLKLSAFNGTTSCPYLEADHIFLMSTDDSGREFDSLLANGQYALKIIQQFQQFAGLVALAP